MRELVVFDMDDTLLLNNSWVELHRAFGLSESEDRMMLDWFAEGVLTYRQWADLIARIYRSRKKANRGRADAAFRNCSLHPSVHAVVAEMKRRGYEVAILSGGIHDLVADVARRLELRHFLGNHSLLYDEHDRFLGLDIAGNDFEFKVNALSALCDRLGISPRACYCVGDGMNDEKLFELTGRGILICPPGTSPRTRSHWRRISDLSDTPSAIPAKPGEPAP